jgi:hypothetical protein
MAPSNRLGIQMEKKGKGESLLVQAFTVCSLVTLFCNALLTMMV